MRRPFIAALIALIAAPVFVDAQQPDNRAAPVIPFVSVPNYLKYPPEMNLGEILAVAENSKGDPRHVR